MNPVSRRRFLTGAPAVAIAAALGHRDEPKIDGDHRAVIERHLANVSPLSPLAGAADLPSLTEWSRAVDRSLLDLSPKEDR